jgi:hypothetical protein
MTAHGSATSPQNTIAAPMTRYPMTIESRRLTTSATIPVGISQTKIVSSMKVPTRTSWSGLIPTVCTK